MPLRSVRVIMDYTTDYTVKWQAKKSEIKKEFAGLEIPMQEHSDNISHPLNLSNSLRNDHLSIPQVAHTITGSIEKSRPKSTFLIEC